MTIRVIIGSVLGFACKLWSNFAPLPDRIEPLQATFLKNHADSTWACDFIQVYDVLFRQVYAFFIVHVGSRKVVYTAASRNPTEEWTAQQLRNATMDSVHIRGAHRRLDHPRPHSLRHSVERRPVLVVPVPQQDLRSLYRDYFNEARPHQGIGQQVPGRPALAADVTKPILAKPVLGGLIYDFRRAA